MVKATSMESSKKRNAFMGKPRAVERLQRRRLNFRGRGLNMPKGPFLDNTRTHATPCEFPGKKKSRRAGTYHQNRHIGLSHCNLVSRV